MIDKKEMILSFMKEEEYIPMKAKEMAIILRIPKKEYNDFIMILNSLESEYKIKKNRKNKYRICEEEYFKGAYRKNQKGFGFVKIDTREDEIYVAKENSLNALDEDIVLIEITEEKSGDKKAEGKIIKILEHKKDSVVGLFQDNKNFGFVVPDDKGFGSDVFIPKRDFGKAKNGHKVVVKIVKYPENGKKAEGKVIEDLGDANDKGVDMLSLIKEYKLPDEFPEDVLKEARRCGDSIDEKDIPNRVDLRNKKSFTIDSEEAKDLDDAVFVEKMGNEKYRLYVHIADVSNYVKENSLLDQEALLRGTSIYMLGQVIPMLPKELSNGICSLNAGEDRFCITCSMEIDKKGKVISAEVYKSVICVTKRMSYIEVQGIIDNEIDSPYKEEVEAMKELALILKNRRLENGYLNLDVPESKIELDENGKAIAIGKYETTFSNEIIEQFMLTANESVAEKFYWLEAPFIYRVHEIPDLDKVKELNKFLINFGYKVRVKDENIHPKEFSKILDESRETKEGQVVSKLILRTLKVARYEPENQGHFGIASKYYCHFTSPIRRYPDLFVHRIISKYLQENYDVSPKWIDQEMKESEKRAKSSSEREKLATNVERESEKIKKAEFMENKIGEEYEGVVSSVTQFGIFVELENTVEGLVRFEDLGNEYFIYDEENKQLIGEQTNTIYKIGDEVKIKVIKASKELRQIDFAIIKD